MKKIMTILAAWFLVFGVAGCSDTTPQPSTVTYAGSAQGFGGEVAAKVTVDQNGKIIQVDLTGENETPDRGGAAMKILEQSVMSQWRRNFQMTEL